MVITCVREYVNSTSERLVSILALIDKLLIAIDHMESQNV